MSQTDPLIRLLQAADAASVPQASSDFAGKVHQRRKARAVKARQIQAGALSVFAVTSVIALIALNQPEPEGQGFVAPLVALHPPAEPGAKTSLEVATLLRKSQAIQAEADALERLIATHERTERLTELAAEHDRLLVATSAPDPELMAMERAAARAICEADFLLETLNDRLAATQAYRNITEQFPDTRWAMIAQDNLTRLEMN